MSCDDMHSPTSTPTPTPRPTPTPTPTTGGAPGTPCPDPDRHEQASVWDHWADMRCPRCAHAVAMPRRGSVLSKNPRASAGEDGSRRRGVLGKPAHTGTPKALADNLKAKVYNDEVGWRHGRVGCGGGQDRGGRQRGGGRRRRRASGASGRRRGGDGGLRRRWVAAAAREEDGPAAARRWQNTANIQLTRLRLHAR